MQDRHNQRKEEILTIALNVWGSIPIEKRNLGILADACGITKPGLYRYFCGKQAILDGLMERFFRAADQNRKELTALAAHRPLNWEEIIDSNFTFLMNNWRYIRLGIQEGISNDQRNRLDDPGFYRVLGEKSGIEPKTWIWLFNIIIAVVWSRRNDPGLLKMDFRRKLSDRIISGFQTTATARSIAWDEIFQIVEAESGHISCEPAGEDRIAASIFELISEKGMANISLSEVADQLGMKKSSLYNYFASKGEMIESVFTELKDRYLTGREDFLSRFADIPAKLYAHLVFLSWFIKQNPAVIVLITEMKSRGNFDDDGEWQIAGGLQKPFSDAIGAGIIKDGFLEPLEIMTSQSFMFGMDLLSGRDKFEPNSRARRLFTLFIRGLQIKTESIGPDIIRIAEVP